MHTKCIHCKLSVSYVYLHFKSLIVAKKLGLGNRIALNSHMDEGGRHYQKIDIR